MTFSLLSLIIGLFIGWNLPQPVLAKKLQDWVVGKVKSLFKKTK